jgi:hypothetical protein
MLSSFSRTFTEYYVKEKAWCYGFALDLVMNTLNKQVSDP